MHRQTFLEYLKILVFILEFFMHETCTLPKHFHSILLHQIVYFHLSVSVQIG